MSIRLDPDVKAALQGFAEDEDRSLSSYVNRVLRDHVARLEVAKEAEAATPQAGQDASKRPPERS